MTKKTISTEDSLLFKQAVGEVKTVNKDKLLLTSHNESKPNESKPILKPPTKPPTDPHDFKKIMNTPINSLGKEDNMQFVRPHLRKNIFKKLRKGVFYVHDSIDLHGLNRQEAHLQLCQFLQNSIGYDERCVHIIHGKGYGSPNEQPILKNWLNVWLRQHESVLAFCSAPLNKGGTGTVFVLLKLATP